MSLFDDVLFVRFCLLCEDDPWLNISSNENREYGLKDAYRRKI